MSGERPPAPPASPDLGGQLGVQGETAVAAHQVEIAAKPVEPPVATATPAPAATATPESSTVAPPPFIRLEKTGATFRPSSSGAFSVAVLGCAGCRATLSLLAQKKVRAKRGAKAKRMRLANVRFVIDADGAVRVKVKLTRPGRALLERLRRIRATVKLTATDAAGNTVVTAGTLKIRR